MSYPCPCCGYLTLSKSVFGAYEVCPVCFWEDDWQQAENPDQATGANQVSLKRAKLNFRLFGAVEERYIGNVRRPRENERPAGDKEPAPQEARLKVGDPRETVRQAADRRAAEAAKNGSDNGSGSHGEGGSSEAHAIDIESIREAATRITPHANHTPVMTSSYMDSLAGRSLFFKCEIFQKVGAFKFRGACNAVMKLSDKEAKRGVVTHSSGNHAQALALAANLRGIRAYIVMPNNSSAIKIRAVECYGGRVTLCEPNQESRESTAQKISKDTGAMLIPPYNHPDVIAGQGTVTLELMAQVAALGIPELDALIAPIGGGGLISGACIAAKAVNPKIRIFAAEPSGADDAARSLATGTLQPQSNPKTIADGLLTGMGDLTWPIVRDHVERVLTLSDERIIAAMRLVFERMKLVIEPSAATAVAAALSDDFRILRNVKRVGVILSGGNVDLDKLPWVTGG